MDVKVLDQQIQEAEEWQKGIETKVKESISKAQKQLEDSLAEVKESKGIKPKPKQLKTRETPPYKPVKTQQTYYPALNQLSFDNQLVSFETTPDTSTAAVYDLKFTNGVTTNNKITSY